MNESELSQIEFELRKLIVRYAELFEYHRWPSEHARWVELGFALLSTVSQLPEPQVREAVETLDALDLLEIDPLASADDALAVQRITSVLEEAGFSTENARRGALGLRDAARSLTRKHGGKVQRYLRQYGRQMLNDLDEEFSFETLDADEVDRAFRYWLQNALNMPIELPHPAVATFAFEHGVSRADLVEAADSLGLNLALLDDIIVQRDLDTRKTDG